MTRKLLPYEHQLIQELGITESEYHEFLRVQFDYTTTPEQRLATPQNAETVAIVLTVVGILFQVASMLLMPKLSLGGRRQAREQVFLPRFGFNSAQELAKYGDTVNLVYTNTSDNPTGGVRVAAALIWSAIESFGSSQYMQMLLALGAGRITTIDATRIAFGQTPIRQFPPQQSWAYYNPSGNVRFSNLLPGGTTDDPARKGSGTADLVYRVNPTNGLRQEGFSQAFSPTTLTKCGVYFPIPINVSVVDRLPNGKPISAPIGITVDAAFIAAYWQEDGARPLIPVGAELTLTIKQAEYTEKQKEDVIQTASEKRRSFLEGIDFASTYMLGSAKFRLKSISNPDLEIGDSLITFVCTEPGNAPAEKYSVLDYRKDETQAADAIAALQQEITDLQTQLTANPPIYKSADIEAELQAKLAELQVAINGLIDYEENGANLKTINLIDPNTAPTPEIAAKIIRINDLEEELEVLRDTKPSGWKTRRKEVSKEIKELQKQVQEDYKIFFDGDFRKTRKERAAAIEALRAEATTLASNTTIRDLEAEAARNADWQASIDAKQAELDLLEDEIFVDNYYHTKCLVKYEEAAYETITECRVVDFALRARVFKRISNRSKRYGEKKENRFKNSDNGTKLRSTFFRLRYRKTGESWNTVNRIFVVRRGNDIDNFISLKFLGASASSKWQFQLLAVAETAAEMKRAGNANFAYLENTGDTQVINNPDGTAIYFVGTLKNRVLDLPPLNNNPAEIDEWSLFSLRSDTQIQFSFDNGPELEIKAVTEQSIIPLAANFPNLYQNLSLLGFNAYSGQGIQDLRSITAFVTQGRAVRRLRNDGTLPSTPDGPSNYASDIFLDTILDGLDGIGRFAKIDGIDLQALALAKRFCQRNQLFMDCVIADQQPWRQFWSEVAPFSLLELGRIGGKETLVPAVPVDNAGNIIRQVPVSAMFNAGNILEGSYKEEFIDYGTSVQDLIATVIYRDTEQDGFFPRNRSVDVSLAGVTEAIAIRQTFDLSQYVTNRDQAILFAKLMCNQRRHIRRAAEFRTFPTDSVLSPGAYIYVDIGQAQWQGIYSGSVQSGGALNTPITGTIPNGTYSVLLWKSGQSSVVANTVSISNNASSALASYAGWLFVLGTPVRSKRVFRITEVQMDEEGEVGVKALEHPCDTSGNSLITDFADSLFTIR